MYLCSLAYLHSRKEARVAICGVSKHSREYIYTHTYTNYITYVERYIYTYAYIHTCTAGKKQASPCVMLAHIPESIDVLSHT